jgi:enoyl-CoA hydratase
MRETEGLPEAEAFKVEAPLGMAVFGSADAREGPKAFAEKRKPDFRGQ